MNEQKSELTDLQRAMIEHDDDMARLDRNTLLEVVHEHHWHTRRDAPSYCCVCIEEVEACVFTATTNTPVSQPSGEAPEGLAAAQCRRVVKVVTERAKELRRMAQASLLDSATVTEFKNKAAACDEVADIIAAEFGSSHNDR